MSGLTGRELAVFLRAGLDADEAVALAATRTFGPDWRAQRTTSDLMGGRVYGKDRDRYVAEAMRGPGATYIARHDPARVLREVTGKRAIVEAYEDALDAERDCLRSDGSGTIALERAWLETCCQHLATAYEETA